MHVFLTGELQVGKSTLLRRTLEALPQVETAGFRTVTVADVPGAVGSVYIVPAVQGEPRYGVDCRVAVRWGPGRGAEGFPAVFDSRGVELLAGAEKAALIVMDEVGYLESAAPRFSERVGELLDGDTPIFGVARLNRDTSLLRRIRSHPKVRLVEVTEENRDALLPELTAALRREVNKRVDSAGALVLRGGEQVLMIRSRDAWAFPKGHIEPGESAEEAAVREVREETGIIASLRTGFRYETVSALPEERRKVIYFLGESVGGVLAPQLSEISGCAWQPLSEAEGLLRFAEDAPALQAAIRFCEENGYGTEKT